jgi:uncharacterized membrane protein YhhN
MPFTARGFPASVSPHQIFMTLPQLLTASICLGSSIAAVVSERKGWRAGRGIFKTIASTAFVVLGLLCGAAETFYGHWLLAGLVLCWIGDVFLLSFRKDLFLIGTVAFLFAHFAFIAAFASLPLNWITFYSALALAGLFAAAILVWLWPRLNGIFKVAIPLYVAAILTMTAMAIAASVASGPMLAAAGAIAFTASDVSVARDRFVVRDVTNYGWGLPLYFLAMILLAYSAVSKP